MNTMPSMWMSCTYSWAMQSFSNEIEFSKRGLTKDMQSSRMVGKWENLFCSVILLCELLLLYLSFQMIQKSFHVFWFLDPSRDLSAFACGGLISFDLPYTYTCFSLRFWCMDQLRPQSIWSNTAWSMFAHTFMLLILRKRLMSPLICVLIRYK